MQPTAKKNTPQVLYPLCLLLLAMISLQGGASLAKSLFPVAGAPGFAAIRLGLSTIMLWIIFKPWRLTLTREQRRPLMFYGLSLGGMNFLFYLALSTIPLGVGVALEFLGPLGLVLFNSKKPADVLWIVIAVADLWLLLPLYSGMSQIDPSGAACAIAAGVCWAAYIVYGQKAGSGHGAATVAMGSLIASGVFVPAGLILAEPGIWHWAILPWALLIALLSNIIPYSLEMMALNRLPARVFGTLMSMEPAIAALSGLLFLNEILTLQQISGLIAIILASAGSTLTIEPAKNRVRRLRIKKTNNNAP